MKGLAWVHHLLISCFFPIQCSFFSSFSPPHLPQPFPPCLSSLWSADLFFSYSLSSSLTSFTCVLLISRNVLWLQQVSLMVLGRFDARERASNGPFGEGLLRRISTSWPCCVLKQQTGDCNILDYVASLYSVLTFNRLLFHALIIATATTLVNQPHLNVPITRSQALGIEWYMVCFEK